MLPGPRIIVIDDNPEHIAGLVSSLHRAGVACLPVHFTGDDTDIRPCAQVRVIFADLHLNEGGAASDNARHFTVIGGLLEQTIIPAGPYAIVLWTRYADQAEGLRRFLEERLRDVPRPFRVVALDKNEHLNADSTVKDANALVRAISEVLGGQPQIAALLNWEERVLGASAATVASVIDIAARGLAASAHDEAVGALLLRLAIEGVGEENVEGDRFRAVNEALLPILADRVASLRADADSVIWEAALEGQSADAGLDVETAAKLNRLLHFAEPKGVLPNDRGAVSQLPEMTISEFETTFGMAQEDAAAREFGCEGFATGDDRFKWVLVQAQAACDYAQRRPGPLPFVLGLQMPATSIATTKPPGAMIACPVFGLGASAQALHINARFQLTMARKRSAGLTVIYRLREALLNDVVFDIHTYGARPGIIGFRKSKPRGRPSPS